MVHLVIADMNINQNLKDMDGVMELLPPSWRLMLWIPMNCGFQSQFLERLICLGELVSVSAVWITDLQLLMHHYTCMWHNSHHELIFMRMKNKVSTTGNGRLQHIVLSFVKSMIRLLKIFFNCHKHEWQNYIYFF